MSAIATALLLSLAPACSPGADPGARPEHTAGADTATDSSGDTADSGVETGADTAADSGTDSGTDTAGDTDLPVDPAFPACDLNWAGDAPLTEAAWYVTAGWTNFMVLVCTGDGRIRGWMSGDQMDHPSLFETTIEDFELGFTEQDGAPTHVVGVATAGEGFCPATLELTATRSNPDGGSETEIWSTAAHAPLWSEGHLPPPGNVPAGGGLGPMGFAESGRIYAFTQAFNGDYEFEGTPTAEGVDWVWMWGGSAGEPVAGTFTGDATKCEFEGSLWETEHDYRADADVTAWLPGPSMCAAFRLDLPDGPTWLSVPVGE